MRSMPGEKGSQWTVAPKFWPWKYEIIQKFRHPFQSEERLRCDAIFEHVTTSSIAQDASVIIVIELMMYRVIATLIVSVR